MHSIQNYFVIFGENPDLLRLRNLSFLLSNFG